MTLAVERIENDEMISSIDLFIDSDLNKVVQIALAIRGLCTGLLSDDALDAVELSVVEAINNVIEHGYQGRSGQGIRVLVGLHKDQVVIEIVDQAPPMEAGLLNQPTEDRFAFDVTNIADIPEGGMGLALIQMNMDEVKYTSTPGENRLRMVKRIEPRAS